MLELQEALSLPTIPDRIECFDISHVQGAYTVASMSVFEQGKAKSSDYRRFLGRRVKVRTRRPVDVAGGTPAQRSVTGELVGATDADVTVASAQGVVSIPLAEVKRSNLVGE